MTYTLFTVGGQGVAGAMTMPLSGAGGGRRRSGWPYFTVDDCDASVARVQELGGSVPSGRPHEHGGRRAASRSSPIPTARPSASSRASRRTSDPHPMPAPVCRLSRMARQEGWPALFWSAFKGSRNAMVLLDDRRRQLEVNGAYLKMLGYPRDELVGRPVWEFVAGGPQLTERAHGRRRSRSASSAASPRWCAPTGPR